MDPTRPPSLVREIGLLAWQITKYLAVCSIVVGGIAWIFYRNPLAGLITLYGVCFGGMIVYFGWQSYKWKKRDWEQAQEREAKEREMKARLERIK